MLPGHFLPRPLSLLLMLALAGPGLRAESFPADPVEAVRQVLRDRPAARPRGPEWAVYETRLAKQVATLQATGDLGRAALLREWAPFTSNVGDDLADVHRKVRGPLLERFTERVRDLLGGKDPAARAAAATLLGELAGVSGKEVIDPGALLVLGQLTGALVEQFKEEQPLVRLAAVRALGKLPPRRNGLAALGNLLAGDQKDPALAVAAVEALAEAFQSLLFWENRSEGDDFVKRLPEGATSLLTAAGKGLGHADARVRRLCLLTIRQAVLALKERTPEPAAEPQAPSDREVYAGKLKDLRRFDEAVQEQAPAAIRALEDRDGAVALAAHELLEAVGDTRLRLHRFEASQDGKPRGKDGDALPPSGLKEAVPALARTLGHEDVRIRLGSLYVLETLGTEAAPAVAAVVKGLSDDNAFVRWGAVRVLARLAPHEAARVVPGLAGVLLDDDPDVRSGAALALARYGPAAKEAVAKLGEVLGKGDGASRLLAVRALVAVGTEARPALPALVAALADAEAEVRAAAAQAIGRFGPSDKATAEALQKALLDPDGEVRQAAANALLAGK